MFASYRGKHNIFLSMPASGLIFGSTSLLWQEYIVSGIRKRRYCIVCYSIILSGFWESTNIVCIKVDARNQIEEFNEKNNLKNLTIPVVDN